MAEQSAHPASYMITTRDLLKTVVPFIGTLLIGVWGMLAWFVGKHEERPHIGSAPIERVVSVEDDVQRVEDDLDDLGEEIQDALTAQSGIKSDISSINRSLERIESKLDDL